MLARFLSVRTLQVASLHRSFRNFTNIFLRTRGRNHQFLVEIDPRSRSRSPKNVTNSLNNIIYGRAHQRLFVFHSVLQVASLCRAFQNFSKRFLRALGWHSRFLVKIDPRSRSGENAEISKIPILNNGRNLKKSYLRQNLTDIF